MATALHSVDILYERRRRLEQLQARQARLGWNTPPEIANEILDLERELAEAAPSTVVELHNILSPLLIEMRADLRRIIWIGLPLLAVALTLATVAIVLVLVLL